MNNIPFYKRLLYIAALILIALLIGYLIYTGDVLL